MRLDHLLSKESIPHRRWSHDHPVPGHLVGALVGSSSPSIAIAGPGPLSIGSAGEPVFSSVLRESEPSDHLGDAAASSSSRAPHASAFGQPFCRPSYLENCRASTSILLRGAVRPVRTNKSCSFQATKSQRWMPWRQEPIKDVSDCEKLRGAVY